MSSKLIVTYTNLLIDFKSIRSVFDSVYSTCTSAILQITLYVTNCYLTARRYVVIFFCLIYKYFDWIYIRAFRIFLLYYFFLYCQSKFSIISLILSGLLAVRIRGAVCVTLSFSNRLRVLRSAFGKLASGTSGSLRARVELEFREWDDADVAGMNGALRPQNDSVRGHRERPTDHISFFLLFKWRLYMWSSFDPQDFTSAILNHSDMFWGVFEIISN